MNLINFYVPGKNTSLSFTGLSRNLGKRAYFDRKEMEEWEGKITDKVEKRNTPYAIVGSIPHEWVQKIPEANREVVIKELYTNLGEIFSDLRENKNVELASTKLNSALHKANILSEKENVSLHSFGSGRYGTAFILDENFKLLNPKNIAKLYNLFFKRQGGKYVFKLFHDVNTTNDYHGTYIEANKGMYWRKTIEEPARGQYVEGKTLNKTDSCKFYFADLKNGYMVENPAFMPPPKRPVLTELFGLIRRDEEKNPTINGYNYDYGGIEADFVLSKNKTARYVYKELCQTPANQRLEKWESIYNDKKACNYSDRLKGLACGINLIRKQICSPVIDDLFTKLAIHDDNAIKIALAGNLDCLPEESQIKWFKTLAKDADRYTKINLAHNLDSIGRACFDGSKEVQDFKPAKDCFNLLLDDDNKVRFYLAKQFTWLPKESVEGWYEVFIKNADNQLKTGLAVRLNCLPEGSRERWFKILAKDADDYNLKKALRERGLRCLPDEESWKRCKELLED
ncbi:MAG: hypothetical protein A2Y25_04315 [Candidatus Melainabacteria bacterium GWF2_37_15]|nr:MAG: hypothetical protein A2Y25_04315 [Candidatus Melainabacteria bacterium GWF2_37_15]